MLSKFDDKVVCLADFRAAKAGEQIGEQIHQFEVKEPSRLSHREMIWWRNLPFFSLRMMASGTWGAIKYQAVRIDGQVMMDFTCEAFRAFYPLTADMAVDLAREPLLVSWTTDEPNARPISPLPEYEVIND